MDGQGSVYFNTTAPDLISCDQDVSRMSPELVLACSYPLLHLSLTGPSMYTLSDHIGYYVEPELLPSYHNMFPTPGSNLYSSTQYNSPLPIHPNVNPGFILSPENGPTVDSGVSFGAYMDVPLSNARYFQPCIAHKPCLLDADSIPRTWNPGSTSIQYDNCLSLPTTGHETADITINKDGQPAERNSSSQSDANWSSKSVSNMKTTANPHPSVVFNNIKDVFRYACHREDCNKTFARKEHATRHYRTKHKRIKELACEFCGKNTFNRSDNLNAHRKLHARSRSRNSNAVHFVPDAVLAMQRNRKRGRPQLKV